MTEASWYYARENQEHGPVTAAQLKALIKKGEIEPSDLVWKEGMPNWSPAEDVRSFSDDSESATSAVFRPADSSEPNEPAPSPANSAQTRPAAVINLAVYGRWAGYGIVLFSLMFMMTMRGCTSIAAKNEARVQQQLEYTRADFDRSAREKLQPFADALRKAEATGNAGLSQLNSLRDELAAAQDKSIEARKVQESEVWADLETNVVSAAATRATIGFYSQLGFLVASLALLLGLFALAIFGQLPERWLSLIMVAVVLFGLIAFNRL